MTMQNYYPTVAALLENAGATVEKDTFEGFASLKVTDAGGKVYQLWSSREHWFAISLPVRGSDHHHHVSKVDAAAVIGELIAALIRDGQL